MSILSATCIDFFRRKRILTVTNDQLLETGELINNWPLKLHNYRTTIDIFRTCSD